MPARPLLLCKILTVLLGGCESKVIKIAVGVYCVRASVAFFSFVSGLMETFAASALLEKDKGQNSTSRFVKAVGGSQKP